MMRAVRWVLLLLLAGCGAGEVSIVLRPPVEDARSIIVVVDPAGPDPIVAAYDVGTEWRIDAAFEERPVGVVALAYGCPLASIGVPEGRQTIVEAPDGRPLPSTNAVYEVVVEGDRVSEWEQRAAAPDLRIEDRGRALCSSFETDVVNLPEGSPLYLTDLDDGTLLAGLTTGQFRVDSAGTFEPADPARIPRDTSDVFVASDGDLFILTQAPCLLTSDDGGPAVELACSATTSTSGRGFLAGPPVGPDEFFVMTGDGVFSRIFQGVWTTLFSEVMSDPGRKAGVIGLGPGHALAVGPLQDRVLRYRDGRLELEEIVISALDKPISIIDHPTFGPVVGTNLGVLLYNDGNEWLGLGQFALDEAKAMAPVGDGILVGGGQGVFVEQRLDGTVCDSMTLVPGDAEAMIPFGDGVAILSDTTNAAHVTFVRVLGPHEVCGMP